MSTPTCIFWYIFAHEPRKVDPLEKDEIESEKDRLKFEAYQPTQKANHLLSDRGNVTNETRQHTLQNIYVTSVETLYHLMGTFKMNI